MHENFFWLYVWDKLIHENFFLALCMRLAHAMIGTFSYMRNSYHGDFMIPRGGKGKLITILHWGWVSGPQK